METIEVKTQVAAKPAVVWQKWNNPEDIMNWAFASDTWEAPYAENDLRDGGVFVTTMAAKDGSEEFDLGGVYTRVVENELLEYTLDDGRMVRVTFSPDDGGTSIVQEFEPENENPIETQRAGWQAILDNFKAYVEEQ
jgi:uncharacterized protein YndB with AHSA1/START domain